MTNGKKYFLSGFEAVLLFCGLMFGGCNKKTITDRQNLVFAQNEGLTVTAMNAEGSDVNEDGTVDLRIQLQNVKTGVGPNFAQKQVLVCQHANIAILAKFQKQDIFRSETVSISNNNTPGQEEIIKARIISEGCQELPGSKLVASQTTLNAIAFRAGDVAGLDDGFASGSFTIQDVVFKTTQTETHKYPDTTFVFISSFNEACNTVVHEGDNYFCFRLTEGNRFRIGWIKVSKTGTFTIKENAIAP